MKDWWAISAVAAIIAMGVSLHAHEWGYAVMEAALALLGTVAYLRK
jgi:hypothetical protein